MQISPEVLGLIIAGVLLLGAAAGALLWRAAMRVPTELLECFLLEVLDTHGKLSENRLVTFCYVLGIRGDVRKSLRYMAIEPQWVKRVEDETDLPSYVITPRGRQHLRSNDAANRLGHIQFLRPEVIVVEAAPPTGNPAESTGADSATKEPATS